MTIHSGTSAAATVGQTVQTMSGAGYLEQLLFKISAADMAVTTDQAMTKIFSGTKWTATRIFALRAAGAYNTACLGGVYTAASKGGSAIVAATQTYAGLTGAAKMADLTLAALLGTDVQSAAVIYVALTTANGAALTADYYVYGVVLD